MSLEDWMPEACPGWAGGIDMKEHMNAPEPICYSCRHARRRGSFRVCDRGQGYRNAGELIECEEWESADN